MEHFWELRRHTNIVPVTSQSISHRIKKQWLHIFIFCMSELSSIDVRQIVSGSLLRAVGMNILFNFSERQRKFIIQFMKMQDYLQNWKTKWIGRTRSMFWIQNSLLELNWKSRRFLRVRWKSPRNPRYFERSVAPAWKSSHVSQIRCNNHITCYSDDEKAESEFTAPNSCHCWWKFRTI